MEKENRRQELRASTTAMAAGHYEDSHLVAFSSSSALQVMSCRHLHGHICSFQSGRRYADWLSGDQAVRCGSIALLKMKHSQVTGQSVRGPQEKLPFFYTAKAMELAVEGGNLELLQWLNSNPFAIERAFHSTISHAKQQDGIDDGLSAMRLRKLYRESLESRAVALLDLAARLGHKHIFAWLDAESFSSKPSLEAYRGAAAGGHLEMLRWLCDRGPPKSTEVWTLFSTAMANDRLDLVKWIDERYGKEIRALNPKDYLMRSAIRDCREKETVCWVAERYKVESLSRRRHLDEAELKEALASQVQKGGLEILSWLYEHPLYTVSLRDKLALIINTALSVPDARILAWTEQITGQRRFKELIRTSNLQRFLLDDQGRQGVKVLQWLHQRYPERKAEWANSAFVALAFQTGNADVLRWLHSLRFMPNEDFFRHLNVGNLIQWCRLADTVDDQIQVLRWLLAVQPEALRVHRPNIEELQDMIGNPACGYRQLLCLEEIYGQELMVLVDVREAIQSASGHGDVEKLKYLLGLDGRSDSPRVPEMLRTKTEEARAWQSRTVLCAADCGSLLALELLWAHGFDISGVQEVAIDLVRRKHLGILAFLYSKQLLKITPPMVDLALAERAWDVLHWLGLVAQQQTAVC